LLLCALIVQVFAAVRPASIHRPHRRQAEEPGDAEEHEVQEANQEDPSICDVFISLLQVALIIGGIIVGGYAGLRVATTAGWLPIFKLLLLNLGPVFAETVVLSETVFAETFVLSETMGETILAVCSSWQQWTTSVMLHDLSCSSWKRVCTRAR
jgi:hypothetical protein